MFIKFIKLLIYIIIYKEIEIYYTDLLTFFVHIPDIYEIVIRAQNLKFLFFKKLYIFDNFYI